MLKGQCTGIVYTCLYIYIYTRNLWTCFITQMYEINERVHYHNGGMMEGLCEARLKKQGCLSIYGIEYQKAGIGIR